MRTVFSWIFYSAWLLGMFAAAAVVMEWVKRNY